MSLTFRLNADESCLTNGYMDTAINWIPGIEGIIRLKDFPTIIRTTDSNDVVMKIHMDAIQKTKRASAVILNTFDDLENRVLKEVSSLLPTVLTVGPFQLLENQVQNNKLDSIGTSLWKEDESCLNWLDSKPKNSVLLVSFGTIVHLTEDQLIEFAWGLAKSKHNFLWVVRSDLVLGSTSILPIEFQSEISEDERAILVNWCPQGKVLNHPSIGGFLTHCGWNSMLESITAGVPMLCWPAFAEQPTNAWFCCNYWGIGLEIDLEVKRGNVERLVREIMSGQKGKEIKDNAKKWKKEAEKACATNGSSFRNFECLVKLLLSDLPKA